MSFSGKNFIYNNISSEQYGLRFLQIETEDFKSIGGVMTYTTFQNNNNPRKSIQKVSYLDSFEAEVEFVSETKLDDEIDEICNWLLNQDDFKKLYLQDDDYYFNCYFTSADKNNYCYTDGYGIYHIKATMICDSTFKWKSVSNTYTNAQLLATVLHNNISQVRNYTYPTVVFTTGSIGGDVTIQNVTDNNKLITFTDLLPNETITMTQFPKVITSNLVSDNMAVYERSNKKFLDLRQGINNIGIVGDIQSLTISYEVGRVNV